MKRLFGLLLIIGGVFFLGGCNTPDNTKGPGKKDAEDVIFNWGVPGFCGEPGNSPDYPGVMLTLADCPDITGKLGDMSLYGEVIIDARLYADEDGFKADPQVTVTQANSLAHFKILASGDWEDELFPQGNNMRAAGATNALVPADASGDPVNLLVQTASDSGVGYIEIRKLTFKVRTGGMVLSKVFDKGAYMDIDGNDIIFDNAMYSDCAALLVFPEADENNKNGWGVGYDLAGKTITFNFTIPAHECVPAAALPAGTTAEHQIHIQAAANNDTNFNGLKGFDAGGTEAGQKYITLDDSDSTGFSAATGIGSFTVSAQDLISASQVNGDSNDIKGPFILEAVRICNNGDTYQTHIRCKSYTLTINSVTISGP